MEIKVIKHRNHTSHPNHGQDRPQTDPTNCPAIKRPMAEVNSTLPISKQFLVSPTLPPEKSERVCTMPSPGFGIKHMFRERAAPTPVSTMAMSRKRTCPGRVPQKVPAQSDAKSGICAPNTLRNRVKIKLRGNCIASMRSTVEVFGQKAPPLFSFGTPAGCAESSRPTQTRNTEGVWYCQNCDPRWWQHCMRPR